MNLNDINSGNALLPEGKFFLNPICKNISCNTLFCNGTATLNNVTISNLQIGQIAAVQYLSLGSVAIQSTPNFNITLTPSQIISAIFACTAAGGTNILNLPSAVDIAAQFPSSLAIPAAFTFNVYNRESLTQITINLGAGCTGYISPSGSVRVAAQSSLPITFYGNASGFIVFY